MTNVEAPLTPSTGNERPVDIVSYAPLTHMPAQVDGLASRAFDHTFGGARLYAGHGAQVCEPLCRSPPRLRFIKLNTAKPDVFALMPEDIAFEGHGAHPAIKAPIAVED